MRAQYELLQSMTTCSGGNQKMRMVSSESIAEGTYCDACVQPESLEPE